MKNKIVLIFLISLFVSAFAIQKVYLITIHYKKGSLYLKNITEDLGYAQKSEEKSDISYKAVIVDNQGKQLYTHYFYIHTSVMVPPVAPGDTEDFAPGYVKLEEFDFSLVLPRFENASRIDIYNPKDILMLSIALTKATPVLTITPKTTDQDNFVYILAAIVVVCLTIFLLFWYYRKKGG
ncbi:MAG: hypothetical protein QXM75_00770 [Candidatus Diapherotrites archaeon]